MAENYLNGQKTLGEKEKLLVTSNFSFSHIVFKRLELLTQKNQGLFGKGLTVIVLAGTKYSMHHDTSLSIGLFDVIASLILLSLFTSNRVMRCFSSLIRRKWT